MKTRPIHVLLIDDDEDEFVFIRDLLADVKTNTFKLDWTTDIKEAKEKILKRSHDIYLLDYRINEHSGIELLREVIRKGSRVPVIMLTSFHDNGIDREVMSIGAADYLQKNQLSASDMLERTLRYAIYRAQMQTQAISQDRMASIGLIASSLAHEIGTPLGVIRGRAEYLAMQAEDSIPIKKNVEIILSQIDRVSGLIRSLLNLAHGDKSEKTEAISVNHGLSTVLELLAHEFRKNEIEIINLLDTEHPVFVLGQAEKLQQVLLNMTVNSVHAIAKARENGRTQGHFIRFFCRDLGTQYELSIEDSGCGISEENKENLFRPFFTTKPAGKGTGLGLATSQWIVQSWSGSIEVESQINVGTAFRIFVPKSS